MLDANHEYVRLTGHRKLDELLGRTVLDWTAPYEKEKNDRAIENCSKTGHIRNLEIDYLNESGGITPIEVNSTVVDIGGEPRILTLCRDITERKLPADVIGRNVLEFMHPDFREFVTARMLDAAGAGAALPPAEEKLVAADGALLDVEINTVPLTYQGLPCAMAIVQDITPRKKAEEELKAAHPQLLLVNAGLKKRVEERTVQREELNAELEAFSYSDAHDMKAPLRRVNIFAEMLGKEAWRDLNDQSRGLLANIRKSVAQMTNLVEDLLTLFTTGKKPLNLEAVNLAALPDECITEVKTENSGRAIEWAAAPLPEIRCDKAILKQVFTNPLGNAAKYSRGSVPARIEVLYELKGGSHVIGA